MKTTSTLLLALFISAASFANAVQSKLSITVVGNRNIEIVVDNSRYQSQDNSIVINSLQPGSHSIKVYSLRNNRRSIWGNKSELLYSSTVYVKPGYHVDMTIDRNGRASFNERMIRNNRRNDGWDRGYDNRNDRWENRNDRYEDNYGRKGISEQSFSSIVQSLRREYSENSRMAVARQIIDQNNFTSDQVKYLMQLFSFENNRLDIAKFAYRNTVDQRNYFVVYDALSHSNSKEQLADFIRRY